MHKILIIPLFLVLSLSPLHGRTHELIHERIDLRGSGEKFIRTELYFGRSIPTGGKVSESDWQKFVDEVVTARFPNGLTILDADGQWRGKDGSIAREESKVIVLLYPRRLRKSTNSKIEEIRAAYKRRFQQEAVMRIDVTKSVEVMF